MITKEIHKFSVRFKRSLDARIILLFERLTGRSKSVPDKEVKTFFNQSDIERNKNRIKVKKVKNVAFFFMDVSLWKYDTLFREMQGNHLYNPIIFVSPRRGEWCDRRNVVNRIENYCRSKQYKYVSLRNNFFNIGQRIEDYNIDFAFYTQPYSNNLCKEYSYEHLKDSLLCYVPYGFYLAHQEFCYNSILNLIAWRNFYPTNCCLTEASSFGVDTSNIIVTGYPGYDMYKEALPLRGDFSDKKLIIWAPHFSFDTKGWMHLASFMIIYDYMREIAVKYSQKIVIAFKPHPHLYNPLINAWGKVRADSYYNWWKDHGLLCAGENYELFKRSDALIHDSGSFIIEYLYTQKPCMYLNLNEHNNFSPNEAGKAALAAHYHAYTKEDIESFIEQVVLGGDDTKQIERQKVLKDYVTPQNGKTATMNILSALGNL